MLSKMGQSPDLPPSPSLRFGPGASCTICLSVCIGVCIRAGQGGRRAVRRESRRTRFVLQAALNAGLLAGGLLLAGGISAQLPPGPESQPPDTALEDTLPPDPTAPQPIEVVTDERAALDEAIRNQLQAVFDRVPRLDAVDVSVDAGVVRLEGTVVSSEIRARAAELAAGLDGVLFVDNRIRESTSLEEQLEPTWARLRELGFGFLAKLPLLAVAGLIVALAGAGGWLLSRWTGPSFLGTRNPFLQTLIRRFLQGLIVLVGIVVALDLLEATALVGAVVGTAGLAGLALGFAFKDIMENYLAGTILAFRQPFAKDDHIQVDGFEGKVVRLTSRETILMTLDGNHVRLPNALVFRSPLTNFTRNPLRRFDFDAGLGPNDDLARAREVAVATLSGMKGVLASPPPQALIRELGDSSVTMRFSGWMDQRESAFGRVRSEAIRLVKLRLEEAGLTLPSPEYLLQVKGAGSTADREAGSSSADSASATSPSASPAMSATTPPAASTATPPPSPAPAPPPRPPAPEVTQADVSVDTSVDEQIRIERQESDEPDLLDESPPGGARTRPPGASEGP